MNPHLKAGKKIRREKFPLNGRRNEVKIKDGDFFFVESTPLLLPLFYSAMNLSKEKHAEKIILKIFYIIQKFKCQFL